MRILFALFIAFLLVLPNSTATALSHQQTAENVRNKLVLAFGNQLESAPRIKVTDQVLPIANYKSRSKVITIERKVFDFSRQFGKDSLDVLAFIIGHELSHHYRKERGTFGFAKDCMANTSLSISGEERQADIWGAFTAFLAGYRTIELLPEIMKGLYEQYNLYQLKDYPSFKEREQTDLVVFEEVQKMIELHKAAVWLTALGKYELAAANYEYIAQFYPSKEILNNIAVNYALKAINFTGSTIDKFIYPLTLDWSTPLSQIKKSRGEKELSMGELAFRRNLLGKAISSLITIKKLDKNYLLSQLNLINCYALWGRGEDNYAYPKKGVKLYESLERKGLLKASELKAEFQMAYALACFRSNQRSYIEKGKEILSHLKNQRNQLIAEQAAFNLKSFNQKNDTTIEFVLPTYNCPEVLKELVLLDEEDPIYRAIDKGIFLTATTQVVLKSKPSFINFTYEKEGNYDFLLERQLSSNILRKISPTSISNNDTCKWIAVNDGGLLISPDDQSGIYLNNQNQVVETVKFYQPKE